MDRKEIAAKIAEIIEETTGVPPEDLDEKTAFVDDLGLDSLSLLQVAVDVDYAFRLGFPEEELLRLRTVGEAIDLVLAQQVGPGRRWKQPVWPETLPLPRPRPGLR